MDVHSPRLPLPKKIMIIDDYEDIRKLLREFLEANDWIVEDFGNAREALRKLKTSVDLPDAILIDYMMPLENGIYFWNLLNDDLDLCHIPTVMITGHDMNSFNAIGIRAVMKKPIDTDRLLTLLNSLHNERVYNMHVQPFFHSHDSSPRI